MSVSGKPDNVEMKAWPEGGAASGAPCGAPIFRNAIMSRATPRLCAFAALAGLLLLLAGRTAAFDPYDPSKGYCGPSGKSIPAWLEPFFNHACYKHDECYNQCANTGETKSSCDNAFYYEMRKTCNSAKGMTTLQRQQCLTAAAAHFEAVRTGASYFPSYNCTAADLELAKTPDLTFTVNDGPGPVNVPVNGHATLSWTAKRVSDCAAYGGWTGAKSPGPATQQMGPLQSNKIYTLMCRNSSGNSVTKSVEVRVGTAGGGTGTTSGSGPSVELKLNGQTGTVPIGAGQPAVLTWSTRGTAYCQASQGWSGNKSADGGSQSVGPLTATKTYTLTCNSTAGAGATQSVTARIADPVVEIRINGSTKPVTVARNGSATLTWSSRYATSCTASGGWAGNKSVSGGSQSVGPIASTTMYTLYCRNSLGDNAGTSVTARVDTGTTGSGTGTGTGAGTGSGGGTGTTGGGTTATGTKPALDLRINGVAGTINVASGAHVTVTWSARNVVACKASSGWTGDKPLSGSQSFGPITARRQFVLACRNDKGGYVTKGVAVTVGQTGR